MGESQQEGANYREPSAEFVKFRELLDEAGIPWHDASEHIEGKDYTWDMHRTHGDGFSVIYGCGSYGRELGLLEAQVEGITDVTGYLTAEDALELIEDGIEMGKSQQKGAKFEQACADYISKRTGDEVIRKRLGGSQDKGDLHGVRHHGKRVTVECKDCRDMRLAEWLDEAEVERGNDDGDYGIVIHHRKGKGAAQFGENYVTMSLDTFLAMCVGGASWLY